VDANITTGDKQVDMSRVFKKAQNPLQKIQTDTILRNYVNDINNNISISDSKYVHMDIVLNTWSQEELVERIETQYGVHLETNPNDRSTLLDAFFTDLADEVFNKGSYRA
jgi:hypothetical protein